MNRLIPLAVAGLSLLLTLLVQQTVHFVCGKQRAPGATPPISILKPLTG